MYLKLRGDQGWCRIKRKRYESCTRVQKLEELHPDHAYTEDVAGAPLTYGYTLHAEGIQGRSLGWRLDREGVSDPARLLARSKRMVDVQHHEDGGNMFAQHETLPQHEYGKYSRAQAPEIELVVPYHCVPLSSALDGVYSDPNELIFAANEPIFSANAPIDEKLSICLGMECVGPSRGPQDGFSSKQHRVRNKKNGPLITRRKLARKVAADVKGFLV
ncbi:hypothetical protein TRAPUB_13896 [Trametes pubescens]|uniref:Uncharacterized protein n=1 Tax=Trametes pubescens TaxID=154538 RepID=A0A1M2VPX5_TRAPU|nr:hypothetical protein TRAPUB_13896 [Trametes pubescens]